MGQTLLLWAPAFRLHPPSGLNMLEYEIAIHDLCLGLGTSS